MAAELPGVHFREGNVQEQDVGAEGPGQGPGLEEPAGGTDVVVVLVLQGLAQQFKKFLVRVHDQHACGPGFHALQGHAVGLHEADQLVQGDAAILASGNAVAP